MRSLFFILAVLFVFFSCSKEPVINFREGMGFDPDTIQFEASTKGWELYSWNSGENWWYSLLPGTERRKSAYEIYSNGFSVIGREQLKILLRQLPTGEEVVWFGEEWTKKNLSDLRYPIILPPLLTQYDIHSFSQRESILITIIP